MKFEIVRGTRLVHVPLAGKGKLYGEIIGEKPVAFGSSAEGRLVLPASLAVGQTVRFEKGDVVFQGKVLALTNEVLEIEDAAKPTAKKDEKKPAPEVK